jgi:hypothetical protein
MTFGTPAASNGHGSARIAHTLRSTHANDAAPLWERIVSANPSGRVRASEAVT